MTLDITDLIRHPDKLADREVLRQVHEAMEQYPYFQSLRLLYLKGLYLMRDASFGEELRRTALFVPDRRVLFDLIEGEYYTLRPVVHKAKRMGDAEDSAAPADRTQLLIDAFLSGLPVAEEGEENALLLTGAEDADRPLGGSGNPSLSESIASLEEKGKASQPVADDGGLSADYTAYILREDDLPSEEEPETPVVAMKGQHLIDDFIKNADENITSDTEGEGRPMVAQEVDGLPEIDEDDGYFTETLAKIYIKQRRYGKALEIIRRLSLKYPKKNAYFADQIRFLEKLVQNSNDK